MFPSGSSVYFDTAPLIYTTEQHEDYASILEPAWEMAGRGEIKILTSQLTLLEVLVLPIRNADDELIETYKQVLSGSQIECRPISNAILLEAARLRATLNLKTPDAIHAATAIASNCDYLVANDNAFRRLTDINVITLADLV